MSRPLTIRRNRSESFRFKGLPESKSVNLKTDNAPKNLSTPKNRYARNYILATNEDIFDSRKVDPRARHALKEDSTNSG